MQSLDLYEVTKAYGFTTDFFFLHGEDRRPKGLTKGDREGSFSNDVHTYVFANFDRHSM